MDGRGNAQNERNEAAGHAAGGDVREQLKVRKESAKVDRDLGEYIANRAAEDNGAAGIDLGHRPYVGTGALAWDTAGHIHRSLRRSTQTDVTVGGAGRFSRQIDRGLQTVRKRGVVGEGVAVEQLPDEAVVVVPGGSASADQQGPAEWVAVEQLPDEESAGEEVAAGEHSEPILVRSLEQPISEQVLERIADRVV